MPTPHADIASCCLAVAGGKLLQRVVVVALQWLFLGFSRQGVCPLFCEEMKPSSGLLAVRGFPSPAQATSSQVF